MSLEPRLSRESEFGSYTYERESNLNAAKKKRDYRAMLRNRLTGERQEVALFDTSEEINEGLLAQDPQLELSVDVRNALKTFSPIEQRIILRVLVQGQSVQEATKNLRHSRQTWDRWFRETALPRLREALVDYVENGKLVLS